ncbi:hypothetical protein HYC85_003606 [Camellia sinensis]|uniref:PGG domain-containing protein n=1 Tax=Camellia sinensis TaxID=4442 RepID=A0A7J7HVW6_CAMSI|nr:hypothetical protein HYC85_003606 [Camellia sinensis]
MIFMPRIDLWAIETCKQVDGEESDSSLTDPELSEDMSSVKHSQVVEKENHSYQQLSELSETEASQDASKKTSHIWSSFVEQVESMCVSTSLMILAILGIRTEMQVNLSPIFGRYIPLLNAALRGDWDSAKRFFDQDPDALTAHITCKKETALHVAIMSGRSVEFVEKLVDLMSPEALLQPHIVGMIALHNAALIGNTEAAAILVEKHPASLYIRDDDNWLPLHFAARARHKDTLLVSGPACVHLD